MKRIEKRLEASFKKVMKESCPYTFNEQWDRIDKSTVVRNEELEITGCKGITCEECWNKEE